MQFPSHFSCAQDAACIGRHLMFVAAVVSVSLADPRRARLSSLPFDAWIDVDKIKIYSQN